MIFKSVSNFNFVINLLEEIEPTKLLLFDEVFAIFFNNSSFVYKFLYMIIFYHFEMVNFQIFLFLVLHFLILYLNFLNLKYLYYSHLFFLINFYFLHFMLKRLFDILLLVY